MWFVLNYLKAIAENGQRCLGLVDEKGVGINVVGEDKSVEGDEEIENSLEGGGEDEEDIGEDSEEDGDGRSSVKEMVVGERIEVGSKVTDDKEKIGNESEEYLRKTADEELVVDNSVEDRERTLNGSDKEVIVCEPVEKVRKETEADENSGVNDDITTVVKEMVVCESIEVGSKVTDDKEEIRNGSEEYDRKTADEELVVDDSVEDVERTTDSDKENIVCETAEKRGKEMEAIENFEVDSGLNGDVTRGEKEMIINNKAEDGKKEAEYETGDVIAENDEGMIGDDEVIIDYSIQKIDAEDTATCFIGSEDKDWLGIFDEMIGIYNTVNVTHLRKQILQHQMSKIELPKIKRKPGPLEQLLAGGVSGLISRSATAPLDRLKIMLQVHSNTNVGIFKTISNMLKEGGIKSLWRGNGINCLKVGPESAIKFCMFEQVKQHLSGNSKELQIHERLIAGAGSGIIANAAIYPMETIKTKLAIGKTGEYKNMIDCARKIFIQNGMRGFYRGIAPGLMGMIPYAGIDLCIFDTMKSNWLKSHGSERNRLDLSAITLCGATAGSCAQLASYPFGLVRTKLQAQSANPEFTGVKANGMVTMVKTIIRKNGVSGLYRGLIPSCVKVVPSCVLHYVAYEQIKRNLGME